MTGLPFLFGDPFFGISWLDAIILRTMMKDRTKRFPSVAALLQELDRCLASHRGTAARADR